MGHVDRLSLAQPRIGREGRTGHREGTPGCPKVQPQWSVWLPLVPWQIGAVRGRLGAMIADVDASLRSLLRATALAGSSVDVVFDSPTPTWASAVSAGVIDAYLWDIREDVARSRGDWEEVRNDQGRVTGRRPPLHRYRLRYLITAWGGGIADEHRLLSTVLGALADEQAIPDEHLSGDLAEEGLPVFLSVALPSSADTPPWDLWGALGVAPRPALDLVAIAPLPRPAALSAAPPVHDRRISVAPDGGTPEVVPTAVADERIRNLRAPAGDPAPAAPARRRG